VYEGPLVKQQLLPNHHTLLLHVRNPTQRVSSIIAQGVVLRVLPGPPPLLLQRLHLLHCSTHKPLFSLIGSVLVPPPFAAAFLAAS
jgi:hypothetical protein